MSYILGATPRFTTTPQSEAIPGSNQVANNAGGFTWEVDDITRLRRFICLGSEKGSYYVKEKELTVQNVESISRLIASGRGLEVVKELLEFSEGGRTAKQDPILLGLAICARSNHKETKKAAFAAIDKICRIPTFLFTFIQFVEALDANTTGWGRGLRKALSDWYSLKDPKDLAFTITKYAQRNGWSHTDLLRLAHIKPRDDAHQLIFKYIIKGPSVLDNYEVEEPKKIEKEFDLCDRAAPVEEDLKETLEFLRVVQKVSHLEDVDLLCELIKKFKLAREHLPTQHLNSPKVWESLLESMPLTAMIRNLAKMTEIGLLVDGNIHTKRVVDKLLDINQLKKARIHPFNILLAMKTYQKGRGEKGKLVWSPVLSIVDALNKAFYLSFKFVEATGQDVVVGLDVSGSMSCDVLGANISCREASVAMSLVMASTEPSCKIVAFTETLVPVHGEKMMQYKDTFVPLNGFSPQKSIEENIKITGNVRFGRTDCSQPMLWALENKVKADTFIIYTDSETWAGSIHPSEALRRYRKEMNKKEAKLIVVGMASNKFTIADPNDRGMLDIVGFDSNAPEIMRNFMLGLI